jgi:hypothetical protein
MTRPAVLAGLLLLCACASSQWVREDRNAEETDKDIVDCTRHAQREASLRAEGFYGPAGYGPAYGGYATRNRMLDEAGMTDYCMRAKGYRREPRS